MLADDGVVVDLVDGVASIVGAVPCGYVYVDGTSVGDVTETSLKDRRILGAEGFISVVVVVDLTEGKVVGGPEIHARGFGEDDSVFDEVLPKVADHGRGRTCARAARTSSSSSRRSAGSIGKWVNDTHRRRPMIIPVVIEV